jgi:serine protease AprX
MVMGTGTAVVANPGTDRVSKRVVVQFPNREAFDAAQALEGPTLHTPVASHSRHFISVEIPPAHTLGEESAKYALRQLEQLQSRYSARVLEDFQYDLETGDIFDETRFGPDVAGEPSLDDVIGLIRADDAWRTTRGDNVVIAVVDTGVDGTRPEFPAWKRVGNWQPLGDTPWTDWNGHGTMCATIATGTRAAGGAFDGVAPGAGLIACKTLFYESELTAAYDYLTSLATQQGLRIVISNSWGVKTGTPPLPSPTGLFQRALEDALAAGIVVVFSAGNYHHLAGGLAKDCSPNTIWLQKSRADVLTVATCKLDSTMWYYSSRGPGQDFGEPNTSAKPDMTAPTPENGRIVWGPDIRTLPEGWGTSGACPQVAGLAALICSKEPRIETARLQDAIRATARPFGEGPECAGTGLIDCNAALAVV